LLLPSLLFLEELAAVLLEPVPVQEPVAVLAVLLLAPVLPDIFLDLL